MLRPLLLACSLLFVLAPAALADSLVYVDQGGDVHAIRPDGSGDRPLTNDALADDRYVSPNVQDDGTLVVAKQDDKVYVTHPGVPRTSVRTPQYGSPSPTVEIDVPAAGAFYFAWTLAFDSGTESFAGAQPYTGATPTDCVGQCFPNAQMPRWVPGTSGFAVIIDNGQNSIRLNTEAGSGLPWLSLDPSAGLDFDSFDFSRSGTRALLEVSPDGSTSKAASVALWDNVVALPDSSRGHFVCAFDVTQPSPPAPQRVEPSFSTGGTMISWTDAEGLWVAPTPTTGSGGPPGDIPPCAFATRPKLIAPGGSDATWGAPDLAAPSPLPPRGGGPTPSPSPSPSPSPKPKKLVAKVKGKPSRKRGIAFTVTLPRKGTVAIKLARKAHGRYRTIGTIKKKAKAGRSTITVKRIKGKKLKPGSYRARLSAPGTKPRTVRFKVRA